MITWKHPEWFFALGLLVLIIGIFVWYRRRQRQGWAALGEEALFARLGVKLDGKIQLRRFLLLTAAMVSLILALANPQVGRRYERVKQRGVDVIIALDVSQSMLAEDEQPNRLARAKLLIERFLDRLNGDRVGLILFAGDAFVQIPLTSDYGAAASIIRPISPDVIPRQGTAIGEAIRLATDAFSSESETFRALLVISDGENHDEDMLNMAQQAREQGLRIHTIGIGSEEGSTIPEKIAGRLTGNKRDRAGNTVITKMNPAMLAAIAEQGGGNFWKLNEVSATLDQIEEALDQLTEQDFDERYITDYEDQFSWMLMLAFVFLSLEAFFSLQNKQTL